MQQYHPYEDLSCTLQSNNALSLETPWTQIEVEFEEENKQQMTSFIETFKRDNQDPLIMSDFLSNFKYNFISYLTPREDLLLNQEHCTRIPDRVNKLKKELPKEWIESYLPAISHQMTSIENEWKWNLDKILTDSAQSNGKSFDPESAYRSIMHLVLKEMTFKNKGTKLLVDHLKNLAEKNEEKFFQASKIFVRQYHHITSTSSDCLMPAMYNMPYAKDLVMELAHEELGHGQFTSSSYRALGGAHPYELPVDPYTVGLMDLLRQSAHTNALAFSTLFTIFEVSGEQDDDPLATLLSKSSRPKAGDGLQKHFQLNKDGAHFQSGFPLIERLDALDKESIIEAVRFAEILMRFFDLSAMEIIKATQI